MIRTNLVWILLLLFLGNDEVHSLASGTCSTASSSSVVVSVRLLVLDTLVPGQRLRLDAAPQSFSGSLSNSPCPLVVVGREGLSLHTRGVEIAIVEGSDDKECVTLAATGRIAEICDVGVDEGSRWKGREGSVRWLCANLADNDAALSVNEEPPEVTTAKILALSDTVGNLAEEWRQALEVSNRERFPGHLRGILHDLGSMPEEPNKRALWVAGLINPLPALGVALEIRPAVLTARTTSRRLLMAERGLRDSIDRIRRPGPCF